MFKLLGKARFAGQPQQLRVELQPGDGDAGLAHIGHVGQIEVVMEKLAVAGGAGEVEAVADDVLPGVRQASRIWASPVVR